MERQISWGLPIYPLPFAIYHPSGDRHERTAVGAGGSRGFDDARGEPLDGVVNRGREHAGEADAQLRLARRIRIERVSRHEGHAGGERALEELARAQA